MPSPILDSFGRPMEWLETSGGRFRSTEEDRYRLDRPKLYADLGRLMPRDRYKALVSDGRHIAEAFPLVEGAVQQKAEYVSAAGWLPEFVGRDAKYGERATRLLHAALSISDVRGELFNWDDIWENVSRLWDIDGAHFQLFTETEGTAFPQVQNIEVHRIGQRATGSLVGERDAYTLVNEADGSARKVWGAYRGERIVNGVIYNSSGRQIAYRVLGSSGEEDRDISALDMQHTCHPRWFSEGRPAPSIAYAVFDWYDIKETREFERLGQKVNSALTLVESNGTGEAPRLPKMGEGPVLPTVTGDPQEQILFGGLIRYIKNGGNLKAHESSRPSDGWLKFDRTITAGAFYGMGWRIEMMDLSLLSGAGVRGFQDNINMKILARHRRIKPFNLRAVRSIFSKLIRRKDIEEHPEWHMWDIPLPPEFTVDAGRAAQADRDNIRAGVDCTPDVIRRAFGVHHMKTLRKQAQYLVDKKAVAEEFKLDPDELGTLLKVGDSGETVKVLRSDDHEDDPAAAKPDKVD